MADRCSASDTGRRQLFTSISCLTVPFLCFHGLCLLLCPSIAICCNRRCFTAGFEHLAVQRSILLVDHRFLQVATTHTNYACRQ